MDIGTADTAGWKSMDQQDCEFLCLRGRQTINGNVNVEILEWLQLELWDWSANVMPLPPKRESLPLAS